MKRNETQVVIIVPGIAGYTPRVLVFDRLADAIDEWDKLERRRDRPKPIWIGDAIVEERVPA